VAAATRFRMQGVPVFPVAVGSPVPLPDLELVSMNAQTFGVAHKVLRIPFVLRSALGQDRDVRVTLYVDDQATQSKVVYVPAMGQAQQDMVWTPPATGEVTLTLRVPKDAQELIVANNEISTPMSVREEQLKVLVIESTPRWEYRYLRNALERDPGVEVTCLLFHPKLSKVGGGRSYITDFPSASELSRFDVVFLGDVGVGPKQLTEAQVQTLRQLVSAQATGMVIMPGRYGWQETMNTSALAGIPHTARASAQTRLVTLHSRRQDSAACSHAWPIRTRKTPISGARCRVFTGMRVSHGPRPGPRSWPCTMKRPRPPDACP